MALPYPGMDFVPLDILRADELDQMVANIEYLNGLFPVTSSNIDWTTIEYQKGQTIDLSTQGILWDGRQRVTSSAKTIYAYVILPKAIASDVSSITFTPSGYNEAFGPDGLIYSINNPSTSQLVFSASKNSALNNIINITIQVVASNINLQNNYSCEVSLSGTFTLA